MATTRVDVGSDSESDDIGSGLDDIEMQTTKENTNSCANSSGITDVISKILNNSVPKDKGIILAKGSTDSEIKRKKKLKEKEKEGKGEPVKKKKKKLEDGATSSDWTDDNDEDASGTSHLQMQKRKEWNNLGRVKPSILNKERERMLQKIATRGVVQLFNAVRQQQGSIQDKMSEAGSSVRRREKVAKSLSKKQFLDLLDSKQLKATAKTQDPEAAQQPAAKWGVLDENFMTAKMTKWDKDSVGDDDEDR